MDLCRFSGDTQPTQNLVHAAPKTTVLIHEATMDNEEVELARMKAHSTVGEAIGIGKEYVLTPLPLHLSAHIFFHEKYVSSAYLADPFLCKIYQNASSCY